MRSGWARFSVSASAASSALPKRAAEARGRSDDGQPPVVGEGPQLVAFGQVARQAFVAHVQPAVRRHALGIDAQPGHVAGPHVHRVEPDAVVVQPDVAAHDAGQQEGDGRVGLRLDLFAAAGDGRLRRAGQRLEARVVAAQRGQQRQGALVALEVGEMRDLRAAQRLAADALRPVGAAAHRGRVHHQVGFAAVEHLAQAVAEPGQQARAGEIAGHHVQRRVDPDVRRVEQGDEGRIRHHRLQARQHARIAALPDHREQESLQQAVADRQRLGSRQQLARRVEALAQQVEHRARPAVEPTRGQRGALRRTGHAHEALDADAPGRQLAVELAQRLGLDVEGRAPAALGLGEKALDVLVREGFGAEAIGPRQQFAHHAAARMAHHVQPRALGQRPRQRQRVLDGAFRQAAVLEGIDALAVGIGHLLAVVVVAPEPGEAALGGRGRAVDE